MKKAGTASWKSLLSVVVIAASLCGLLAMEVNRRHAATLSGFEARHHAQAKALKHDVDGAFAVIRGLQTAATSHIEHAAALASPYAHAIAPVPGTEGYGLWGLPAPADRMAHLNLTGLGVLGAPELDAELNAALTLEPLFKWVKGIYPESPWAYYLSARRFMAVYPYIPFTDFFMDDAFFSMDLYRFGMPGENPRREPYITPVYEDEAGQGAMVTFGAPVYSADVFAGIVGFDLTVRSLSQVLRQHHHVGDIHAVISESGETVVHVAAQGASGDPAEAAPDLLDNGSSAAAIRSTERGQKPFYSDGWYLMASRLDGAGWVVVSGHSGWQVWNTALVGSLPLMFVLLALAGGGWLYLRERRYQELAATEAALVLERDKLQDMVDAKTRDLALSKEAAEAGAEAKAAFLANMSHEIRTPLNAVLGFAEVGQRDSLEHMSQVCFHRIINSGELLLRVLDDVLDLSAVDAGKLALHEESFSLADVIEDTAGMVEGDARRKSLALTVDIERTMPTWFQGDRVRLQQVLLNLLSNAVKFTEFGTIRVSAVLQEGRVRLDVTDTGIGLSDKEIERLFKPFEQADGSMTRRHGGSGLGLSIANGLVQLMGGTISVSSRRGHGSSFSVSLPLSPVAEPSVGAAGHERLEETRLDGLRILVTDDDPVNRNLLDYLLSREGAEVVFAEDGLQAVEAVRAGQDAPFDMVLMDIQMPVMDGYEATRRIRALAPDLPVVGLTAHVLPDDGQHCREAGMVEHLAKPCSSETLVSTTLRYTRQSAGRSGYRQPDLGSSA